MASSPGITQLLSRWRDGDAAALDQLLPLVYADLARIARREFRGRAPGHTLQPTALLNEALLRLVGNQIDWQDRGHFLAVMTNTIRRVLVDHARARQSDKRGGDSVRVTLSDDMPDVGRAVDLLDLDEAMTALQAHDDRKARIIELHYFGGLKYDEMAACLGLSEATVHRELRFSRAWLKDRLAGQPGLSPR
ncbi:MAG: sigma-70 family RNA polymerase sigma factor [Steroidobacteraceae bacterium]